jgi:PLP dependent protein
MAGMSIADNLEIVHEKIATAAAKSGRDAASVRLVAVSKTKPLEVVREALAAGQRAFGENYVQEALGKIEALPQADWHLIGSLQSKKAKQVVGRFSLIHSVDRLKIAEELDKAAALAGVVQDVLLQIHVGGQETKHGISFSEAPSVITGILKMPALRLRGFMTLPPLTENESEGRAQFASLREAVAKWKAEMMESWQAGLCSELSMGTSSDYEWAVMEGATLVRVGTSIFGAREYP